jgi:WD40 repeat protein
MHSGIFLIVCGVLLLVLAGPAAGAVTPLWVEPATGGGDLAGVVISADDSTIVAGGAQLICLTREGQKRWTGLSASHLDISRDGDYILTSQGPIVRLVSSDGTLLWEQSLELPVTDLSMVPNASVIAANGGGRLRTMTISGEGIAENTTLAVKHVRVMPSGSRILVTTNRDIQLVSIRIDTVWADTNISQDLIATAPDGSSFVTATGNRIRMYKGNGNITWDKKFTGGDTQALAWSDDGSTIVLGLDDNNVQVLNRDGTQLFVANATNWITSVAVSDDGNTIVAGSLDKKVYVYNHAGTRLGTFAAKSPIRFNSVAVTGDGSLIVVVDNSAVYGLSRSSFIEQKTPSGTITEPTPEMTGETETTPEPGITTRKVTSRTPTLPTPYPTESETPESALPPVVPAVALGILFLCRAGKK